MHGPPAAAELNLELSPALIDESLWIGTNDFRQRPPLMTSTQRPVRCSNALRASVSQRHALRVAAPSCSLQFQINNRDSLRAAPKNRSRLRRCSLSLSSFTLLLTDDLPCI